MTVVRIEQILRNFEDKKNCLFFKPRTGRFSHDTRHMCLLYKKINLGVQSCAIAHFVRQMEQL